MTDLAADLALIVEAAREGAILAEAERVKGLEIERKPGGSPVTSADHAVDAFLKERLRAARPDYGWLSEETPDSPERLKHRRIFVVDPIDGTQAFIANRPWWCIPIAVVEDGQPVAAVIHVPELSETFEATAGTGARMNGRTIRASDTDTLEDASLLASAQMLQGPQWVTPWPAMRFEKRNALAYRMALVAAGAFDATVALTPKWDWDVAAGALIAQEAGAIVTDHLGGDWRFNRPDPRQDSLICSAPALHPLILERTGAIPRAS